MSNARCWTRQLATLVIATSLLSGCAAVGSDTSWPETCAPIVEYNREFQARAAEELGYCRMGRLSPTCLPTTPPCGSKLCRAADA